jgi:hypothetical protein
MKPMKTIEPMKPMKSMKSMDGPDSSWWPKGLSSPSSSGSQSGDVDLALLKEVR